MNAGCAGKTVHDQALYKSAFTFTFTFTVGLYDTVKRTTVLIISSLSHPLDSCRTTGVIYYAYKVGVFYNVDAYL